MKIIWEVEVKKCPHCGSDDSYSYKIYGMIDWRCGTFGGIEETIDFTYSKPWPKYAKCDKCGKRIKLSDIHVAD